MSARIDAVSALLWSPFVGTVLLLVGALVAYVMHRDARSQPDYLAPWRDRAPGEGFDEVQR